MIDRNTIIEIRDGTLAGLDSEGLATCTVGEFIDTNRDGLSREEVDEIRSQRLDNCHHQQHRCQ